MELRGWKISHIFFVSGCCSCTWRYVMSPLISYLQGHPSLLHFLTFSTFQTACLSAGNENWHSPLCNFTKGPDRVMCCHTSHRDTVCVLLTESVASGALKTRPGSGSLHLCCCCTSALCHYPVRSMKGFLMNNGFTCVHDSQSTLNNNPPHTHTRFPVSHHITVIPSSSAAG